MFEYKELRAENVLLKAKIADLQKDLDSTWETIAYQRDEKYKEIDELELSNLIYKRLERLACEIEKLLDEFGARTLDYPTVEAYAKSGKYVVEVRLASQAHGTRWMSRDNSQGWS